jgi:hypothetical protein
MSLAETVTGIGKPAQTGMGGAAIKTELELKSSERYSASIKIARRSNSVTPRGNF